jgi:hypothetical protein
MNMNNSIHWPALISTLGCSKKYEWKYEYPHFNQNSNTVFPKPGNMNKNTNMHFYILKIQIYPIV